MILILKYLVVMIIYIFIMILILLIMPYFIYRKTYLSVNYHIISHSFIMIIDNFYSYCFQNKKSSIYSK